MSVPSVTPQSPAPAADGSLTPEVNASSTVESLMNGLLFGISLPERLVRSAVGVTAGTAKEIAEFVVPQAFQDSKSYEVMVRNSLGFLLGSVATVSESPLPSRSPAHQFRPRVPAVTSPPLLHDSLPARPQEISSISRALPPCMYRRSGFWRSSATPRMEPKRT